MLMTYRRVRSDRLGAGHSPNARAPRRRRPRRASPRRSSRRTPSRPGPTIPSAPRASPGRGRPASPATSPTPRSRCGRAPRTRPNEVKENLVDGSTDSKWLAFEPTGWVAVELAQPVAVVHYALTSANDPPSATRSNWTLQGSNDGTTWTTLDTPHRRDVRRSASRPRSTASPTRSPTGTTGWTSPPTAAATSIQLAELQLSDGDTSTEPEPNMRSIVGAGPRGGYNAKSGVGFTGLRAFRYAGRHQADGRALLLQQRLRRRRRASRRRPSCRT